MKDKVGEVLGIPNILPEDLNHQILGPDIIKIYRK